MNLWREKLTRKAVALAACAALVPLALAMAAASPWTARTLLLASVPASCVFVTILAVAACSHRVDARVAEIVREVAQVEPLLALEALIRPKVPLPPMREYAIAPDFARILYELVRERAPKQIVETGSGVSTLVCAYALEANGGEGKVLALDHDATFAAKTRAALAKHGLAHRATVVHAPLGPTRVNDTPCTWYATDALERIGPIDLVVDDGPPGYVGKMARYASLHVLSPKMTDDAPFVLDHVGDEERATIARWCRELPFDAEWLVTKKGNVILRRHAPRAQEITARQRPVPVPPSLLRARAASSARARPR